MLYNIGEYYLNVNNHSVKMKVQRQKTAIFRSTEKGHLVGESSCWIGIRRPMEKIKGRNPS